MAVVPNRNESERSMNVSFAEGEGSAATNKERFEKLKASRQKYKDQATEAKLRCVNLERQLSMLVQQLESSSAAGVGVGNGNDDEGKARMEAEIRELKARLASATATVDKLDDQLADCARRLSIANASLAKAHSDAKEWRAKAERATSTMVGGGGAYEYMCGAVLGAGTLAAAGYVALTYMMKR
uniref:Uncharacterized protein n=1 Tax=Micromonas pusilla TaxID=38833 RepID=A0A7S0I9P7_MICPS|mmetsp:Transcript_12979/g.54899  ORF Transcript_12979/g.54899 Transcript_12979/m.54899 type:complete len:184 (+) Transcript_12979:214-765(+)